jgi:hypothetical protein
MAIGNYYPISPTVVDQDLFLGTKLGGNNTVNYTAQTVSEYLSTKITIGGQVSFRFDTTPNLPRTIFFSGGGGSGTPFSSINQLIVSSTDALGANITVFLNYINGSDILLSESTEPNIFGHYKITGYTVTANPAFYTLNLQFIGGNGSITNDTYYNLSSFVLSSSGNAPTLDQVLTAGNTSLLNAKIGSLYLYDTTEINYGYLTLNDSEFKFYDTFGSAITMARSSIQFMGVVGGFYGTLVLPTVTANRTYTLPNASGTLALTSDIPIVTTPNLNQVLTAGNVSLLDAKIGVLYGYDNNNADYGTLEFYDSGVVMKAATTNKILFYNDGLGSVSFSNGTYSPTLNFAGVGNNLYTFQNANGTLAFLSDIPSLAGYVPTSRTLTINGTIYDLSANRTWNVGTVTSVGATGPITSTGGNTPIISTSMGTNKLIGRSTTGTGVMEEITIGSGLTLSGGTLSATSTGGSIPHATATGTDTYVATITGVSSYADGDAYLIRFTNGNTTGATLNINALGAVPLYENNNGPLIGGDIWDGGEMLCTYNSTLNIFQCIGTSPNSLFAYVTNADASTITKGQVVCAFGGTGDRLTVKLANNVGDSTSAQTVGVVLSTSIATNQKGIIIVQGLLDGLSILPTATWADGDPVYLGATPGSITKVKPYAPNHLVYLGVVTTASNGSAGRWYVRVQNGYELDELHNVQAQSPAVNDILYYFGGSPGQWKTASIPTVLGYTPQEQITLTTTGTSGPATLVGTTLNIPEYAGGGGSTPIDIQLFTSSGVWTKPAGATIVEVYLVSGGGGGGSGRRGATLTARYGGGGGASGAMAAVKLQASALGTTENIWLGVGGNGGAAITVNDTNGNPGTAGSGSLFGGTGTVATSLISTGTGVAAVGGTAVSQSSASFSQSFYFSGILPANTYTSTSNPPGTLAPTTPGLQMRALTYGGMGGGLSAANVASGGQAVNITAGNSTKILYSVAASANGVLYTSTSIGNLFMSTSGGGGRASDDNGATPAAAGGIGGFGSGGGGGGASSNGFNSGAGGKGGDGFCMIITYF